jgi:predicted nucleic acid-binding protein
MPDNPKSIYWDSCVFLHYIEGTPQWMPILDALLEEASETKDLVIYTSSVSITEVAFAQVEKTGQTLDPAVESEIDALWNDRSAVKLVEFNEIIARAARTLLRRAAESGRQLKPMDAIHLATAQSRNVTEFHTTDDRLKAGWQDLGFPVQDPFTQRPKLFTS